jgi:YHS domain-containing protein
MQKNEFKSSRRTHVYYFFLCSQSCFHAEPTRVLKPKIGIWRLLDERTDWSELRLIIFPTSFFISNLVWVIKKLEWDFKVIFQNSFRQASCSLEKQSSRTKSRQAGKKPTDSSSSCSSWLSSSPATSDSEVETDTDGNEPSSTSHGSGISLNEIQLNIFNKMR